MSRWWWIGIWATSLFWLSLEDTHTEPVVMLGLAWSVVGWRAWWQKQPTLHASHWGLSGLGALIGATASLATVGLMFLKTAWHSHLYPDYPPLMMLAMLQRAPIWALAGGLLGLAVTVWGRSVRHAPHALDEGKRH